MRKNPEQEHCKALMRRLEQYHPDIANLIYHIPNESKTAQHTDIGIKAGTPDYCLPIASGGYGALYIEMKAPSRWEHKNGGLSDDQIKRIGELTLAGNKCVVCYSWQNAEFEILKYLGREVGN